MDAEVVGIILAALILSGVIIARVVVWVRERKGRPGKLPGVYGSGSFRITGIHRDSGLPEIETLDDDD